MLRYFVPILILLAAIVWIRRRIETPPGPFGGGDDGSAPPGHGGH